VGKAAFLSWLGRLATLDLHSEFLYLSFRKCQ
jgi:hypothetical protein